ncbi:MAG: hypothetical protein ACP5KN_15275 [Armatimonadota bacterium]
MPEMPMTSLGPLTVSRLIIGGNPFSGHSHWSAERNEQMKRWWTVERIKECLHEGERLGVNTFLGRGDNHIQRMLLEYWGEGGQIQWIAQTAPERASAEANIRQICGTGASACFLHGGMADAIWRDGDPERMRDWVALIKELGMVAGMASHNWEFPLRAEEIDLGCDFYMCCFYDLYGRGGEVYENDDREAMCETIQRIDKPCIAYKIMAAGRNEPEEAFSFAFEHIKPTDPVCVGIYTEDHPDQLAEDVELTIRFGGTAE